MEKDYLKEAEENVVKTAKYFDDLFKILDALANFGNRACHEHIGKKYFLEGLQQMRYGLLQEFYKATSDCFMFSGVGGEKCAEYSRKMFKEHFVSKDQYVIINFLEEFNQHPGQWVAYDENEFRVQAAYASALDSEKWIYDHITVDKESGEFICWDETQSREIHRGYDLYDAVCAIKEYAKKLEDEK